MHSDLPLHPKPTRFQDELLSDESSDFALLEERKHSPESPVRYLNQSCYCF